MKGENTVKITSAAFSEGASIPAKYTADGDDLSPPLAWTGVPGAKSYAIICDDPDAPSPRKPAAKPWVHWVLLNIPAERRELPEGVQRTHEPPALDQVRQGKNSWGADNIGYRGPAPPPGSGKHRYFFRLFALDKTLDLSADATKDELMDAMSGHILATGQLHGVYERP
jgi:Raf kinase inhibitor-like YbhB/YbcL family protein